ncbi:putative phosphodiesterase [Bradyrhizobium sp. USDA 3650]
MIAWLFSDTHLEMSVWDLPQERPKYDVVIVAGDLITRAERGVAWLRDRFPDTDVIYVAGNLARFVCIFAVSRTENRRRSTTNPKASSARISGSIATRSEMGHVSTRLS